jgi:glucose-6-phosphate isomerase
MTEKRYEDPHWTETQVLTLDYHGAMAEGVGEAGLRDEDLEELASTLGVLDRELAAARQNGRLAFLELPYQVHVLPEIRRLTKPLLEWCWEFVVLATDGLALGVKALHQALCHPQHNYMPIGQRHHRPGLWVVDSPDSDRLYGLLDSLRLRRTVFNVISKSGSGAQTLAQFLFVYRLMQTRVSGQARGHLVVTTDPEQGVLRRLVAQEGFPSLGLPANVEERFALLSPAGLLPAAMVGVDLEEWLAGARFMDQRLKAATPEGNLAYRLAGLIYLFASRRGRPILVFMPGAAALSGLADWFCQLWAESLGKKSPAPGGPTPESGRPSHWQLYLEGPQDKLITFLEVEKLQHRLEIPKLFGDLAGLNYLEGRAISDLSLAQKRAAALHLREAGRPSLTLSLPEINAFTIGQLIYLLEVVTVAAASLFAVNPLDQPGVERLEATTGGLLGRPGGGDQGREVATAPPPLEKYRLS